MGLDLPVVVTLRTSVVRDVGRKDKAAEIGLVRTIIQMVITSMHPMEFIQLTENSMALMMMDTCRQSGRSMMASSITSMQTTVIWLSQNGYQAKVEVNIICLLMEQWQKIWQSRVMTEVITM